MKYSRSDLLITRQPMAWKRRTSNSRNLEIFVSMMAAAMNFTDISAARRALDILVDELVRVRQEVHLVDHEDARRALLARLEREIGRAYVAYALALDGTFSPGRSPAAPPASP